MNAVLRLLSIIILACITILEVSCLAAFSCPQACRCKDYNRIVLCVYEHLAEIPNNIPPTVERLDLSNNLIGSIDDAVFGNMSNLTVLNVQLNTILRIGDNAFNKLSKLEELDLSRNGLFQLSPTVFRDLTSLRVLYLDANPFPIIPNLTYPKGLIELSIGSFRLRKADLPPSFQELNSLRTLNLTLGVQIRHIDSNDLKWLTSSIEHVHIVGGSFIELGDQNYCKYQKLRELSWRVWESGNVGLTELERTLESLKKCTKLSVLLLQLFQSKISVLTVTTFKSLRSLEIEKLELTIGQPCVVSSGTFQHFLHLEYLQLTFHAALMLNDTMSDLTKLINLTLTYGSMTDFPQLNLINLRSLEISNLKEVIEKREVCTGHKFIYLTHLSYLQIFNKNLLEISMECFTGLYNLETLDLSQNGIISMHSNTFYHVPNLKTLILRSNDLLLSFLDDSKPSFSSLSMLQILDLSYNQLYNFYTGVNLSHLLRLNLSHNLLGEELDRPYTSTNFLGCPALQTLILSDNRITSVPAGLLDKLFTLQWLDLSNNDIVSLDGIIFLRSSLISLSGNKVSIVPSEVISRISPTSRVDFTGNPFNCSCDLISFRRWITHIKTDESRLPGLSQYVCDFPVFMHGIRLLDFSPDDIVENCFPPPWRIFLIVVAASVSGVMTISGTVAYHFRWSVRLHLYNVCKQCKSSSLHGGYQQIDADNGEDYDLMVSYFADDEGGVWVRDVLVPTIDRTEPTRLHLDAINEEATVFRDEKFLLFYEERDVNFNKALIGAIVDAMQKARKVMLVVTEGYLKENRCRFEMEQAVYKSCSSGHGVDDVIVVLFEESIGIQLLGSLHRSLKLNSALRWVPNEENGKRLFWRQLKDRLTQDR
jgi:Leucine-rich repeat (LRR) protein